MAVRKWGNFCVGIACIALVALTGARANATVVAATGFNDQSGINSEAAANSPYELGAAIVGNGAVETGWDGAWQVISGPGTVERGAVNTNVVWEGDGALRHASGMGTSGTANDSAFKRQMSSTVTGMYTADYYVRVEQMVGARDWVLYTGDASSSGFTAATMIRVLHDETGAVNLGVYDGNGEGGLTFVDSGQDLTLDTWYKLTASADESTKRWSLYLDDALLLSDIGFRFDTAEINGVASWLTRGNSGSSTDDAQVTYVDAVVVTSVPEPTALALAALGLAGVLYGRSRRVHRRTA